MNLFSCKLILNVIENLDLRPSQSPRIGRSNLVPISNSADDSIASIAGAVLNQIFSHVGYTNYDIPIKRDRLAIDQIFGC